MQKIVIIGAGFGGLAGAFILSMRRSDLKVTVIDKKQTFDFLPLLPDTLGRGICPAFLTFKISALSKKFGFSFLEEKALAVDLENKLVHTVKQNLAYDYLVIAAGSETNFYGNSNIEKYAYPLDNAEDSRKIISALKAKVFDSCIVAGGGYTGIEAATNIRRFFDKQQRKAKVLIVERAASILASLSPGLKDYVSDNLEKLGIKVFTNTLLEKIEDGNVRLGDGEVFNNALVIWAAGVKTPDFIQNIKTEKNQQGRLKVDEYLRLNNSCFVVGDAAYFQYKNNYLRMAVQFAISQGRCVAYNILRTIKGKSLRRYKPLDLGYVIPMANNNSCGKVFGLSLKGKLPTLLHFLMCIYRSHGTKNKIGLMSNLLGMHRFGSK